MSSWDISFCINGNCKRKDCRRHYTKAHEAFERGAAQLSFFLGDSHDDGKDCKHYWEE